MTFKWTYIAAAALMVGAIIVSLPVDGGLWGAVSHIHGIVLMTIGGALVLLSRTTKPKPPVSGNDVPFVSYPEHQVLAILETRDAAAEVIRELRNRSVSGDLNIYYGLDGAAAIDSEGLVHGVVGVAERSVEHLVADLDDMSNYDEAVRAGRVVISFDGQDEDIRRRGADVLQAHGGHTVQYFGPLAIEVLDVDRSRTRMGPDPTQQPQSQQPAEQHERTEA